MKREDSKDPWLNAELSGGAERPTPVETAGRVRRSSRPTGTAVDFELKWKDPTTPAFAAHVIVAGLKRPAPSA